MAHLLLKCANILIVFFFIAASLVQINDENAYLWVPIYMVPAVLCFTTFINPSMNKKYIWRKIKYIHSVTCVILLGKLGINLIPIINSHEENLGSILEHQEAREFAGVFIVFIWLHFGSEHKENSRSSSLFAFGFLALSVIPIILWSVCLLEPSNPHLSYCKKLCST